MKDKTWKTSIWHGKDLGNQAEVYGSSVDELHQSAKDWLRENKPHNFSGVPTYFELSERSEYGYSDGSRRPAGFLGPEDPLSEGWYYFPASFRKDPELLDSFEEIVGHFVEHSLYRETGPDYKHVPLVVDSETQYHLIERVKRSGDTNKVNGLLQRGWTIIAIEYDGRPAPNGKELAIRNTTFVLAHADREAN